MNEGEVWWGNAKTKDHLENLGVDVKSILNWILQQ
jgi:hypothetical protein